MRTTPVWLVRRMLLSWVVGAIALTIVAALLPGVRLGGLGPGIVAAAIVGLAGALVWPLIVGVALPVAVFTLGLAALALDAALLLAADGLVGPFDVSGLGTALIAVVVLAAVTSLLSNALALDDDSVHRRLLRRRLRRSGIGARTEIPGVLFLEIDGLSLAAFRRALRDGHLPTLAEWRRSGGHRLIGWECDLSSQTGASQAGLLHGCNHDLPAFRWFEKEHGRIMVSNHPRDAEELERRVSDGAGLLAHGGASRGNLCSGDAPRSTATMSTALARGRGTREDYYAFFSDPQAMGRTVALCVADIARELMAARRQRRDDVRPRVHRGGAYPLLRASTTVVLRDIAIQTLIADVLAGVPVAYATFVGYDEVAHHSGVERSDALAVLRRLDRQFARLAEATTHAPRPYRLVVLSDHGQSQGATFRQRYGRTLEAVVAGALAGDVTSVAPPDEGWGHLGTAVTDVAAADTRLGSAVDRATRRRRIDGAVALGETRAESEQQEAVERDAPSAIVMPSGNLALVYLPAEPRRLTREEIDARHPALIPALRAHPGIGLVLVRSAEEGALALGRSGWHRLADGAVAGEDPLVHYGANAAAHLRRTDGFPHAPDLLVISVYDPELGEVAAFEELVGSHGGLGGEQSRPFAFFPADWPLPDEPIVGAEAMHRVMKGWLAHVGQPVGRREADPAPDGAGV